MTTKLDLDHVIMYVYADSAGPAVCGVGLRPLDWWDCGFESLYGHECSYLVRRVRSITIWKSNFVISVRLSVRMINSAPTERIFAEFGT